MVVWPGMVLVVLLELLMLMILKRLPWHESPPAPFRHERALRLDAARAQTLLSPERLGREDRLTDDIEQ